MIYIDKNEACPAGWILTIQHLCGYQPHPCVFPEMAPCVVNERGLSTVPDSPYWRAYGP